MRLGLGEVRQQQGILRRRLTVVLTSNLIHKWKTRVEIAAAAMQSECSVNGKKKSLKFTNAPACLCVLKAATYVEKKIDIYRRNLKVNNLL